MIRLFIVRLCVCRNKINTRQYNSIEALKQDVLLIYDNCDLYNDADSDLCKEAKKQRKNFRNLIKSYE